MPQTLKERKQLHAAITIIDSKSLNICVKYPVSQVKTKAKRIALDVLGGLAVGAFVFVICAAMALFAPQP